MPILPPGMGGSFFFFSNTTGSVATKSKVTEAVFCNTVLVTLVGSITPALIKFYIFQSVY